MAACMGAVATTVYAVASCHFVVVEFVSINGGFDDIFESGAGDVLETYKTGAGLFTWLEPIDWDEWEDGECVGYTERARETISDTTFEAARFMGVFVVLFGLLVLIWTFCLACMTLRKWQRHVYQAITLFLCIMTCLTFLIKKSALCHEVGLDTECSLAEGGLVNIAGAILWFVAFLISVVFVRPSDVVVRASKMYDDDEEKAQRRQERKRQRAADKRKKQEERDAIFALEDEAKLAAAAEAAAVAEVDTPPSTPGTQESPTETSGRYTNESDEPTIEEEDEGQFEVYIGKFLDKIENLVDG